MLMRCAVAGYPWRGDRELTNAADPMIYYEGSTLAMDWTLQHACGDDPSTYCQVVIQYACEEYTSAAQAATAGPNTDDRLGVGNSAGLRDGYPSGPNADAGGNNGADNAVAYKKATFATNGQNGDGTNTIPFDTNNPSASAQTEFGMHETFGFYQACTQSLRNKGLYTADQNLNRNDARATRQNPNGNRRGLECPEERDYYPSWHASPWKDAAILVRSSFFVAFLLSLFAHIRLFTHRSRRRARSSARTSRRARRTRWTGITARGRRARRTICSRSRRSRARRTAGRGTRRSRGRRKATPSARRSAGCTRRRGRTTSATPLHRTKPLHRGRKKRCRRMTFR
jgi:hypothetical protein